MPLLHEVSLILIATTDKVYCNCFKAELNPLIIQLGLIRQLDTFSNA